MKSANIHPVFDRITPRAEKEKKLGQKAKVLWFTGLSGSGKTTLAIALEKKLEEKGFFTQVLDGDNVRTGINNNLGFSSEDRTENIRRIAEVSKLFLNCGIITINSFVSPAISMRKMAKDIIGGEDFVEIFINTPLEICEKRDVKGLYHKARSGIIKDLTGIGSDYEPPLAADIEINTNDLSINDSVELIFNEIFNEN